MKQIRHVVTLLGLSRTYRGKHRSTRATLRDQAEIGQLRGLRFDMPELTPSVAETREFSNAFSG